MATATLNTEQEILLEEQWALLHRVLESRLFRRSHRLREMLSYIGEQHLQNGRAAVREQEIGEAVFGRSRDYDTSLDNIVRVNATELRKRLEQYFATEGAGESLVLDVPRGGGYTPRFHRRAPLEDAAALAHGAGTATAPAPEELPGHASSDPVFVPPVAAAAHTATAEEPHRAAEQPRWPLWLMACCVVLLGAACAGLAWQNHRLQNRLEPWRSDADVARFWGAFFEGGRETDIVTADTSLALEEDVLQHQVSLEQYLNNSYRADAPGSQDTETQQFIAMVRSRNNGSIGDFQVARRILALNPSSASLRFGSARDFLPEAVRTNNLILIGARTSNPWVDLFKDKLTFYVDFDIPNHRSVLVNRHPAPGEQPTYASDDSAGGRMVYSVVAFLPNLDPARSVLLIAGTDSQATQSAGDFITSPEGLTELRRRLHGFPHFEVLLRSSRMAGTTLKTEILATRADL